MTNITSNTKAMQNMK